MKRLARMGWAGLAGLVLAATAPAWAQDMSPDVNPAVPGRQPAPDLAPYPGTDLIVPESGGTTGMTMPGSGTTGVPSASGGSFGRGAVIAHIDPQMSFEDRRDGGQRSIELLQTTLLNTLGSLGFGETRDVRKEGDRYIAATRTPSGDWITVELNPLSGTITRVD